MSTSTVIGDVTLTLEELLRTEQQSEVTFGVSHRSPAEEAADTSDTVRVNVYLFRVVENAFAKNRDWVPVSINGLQKPPLTLDLFYVLTPFAKDEMEEHWALGEAMRILYDNAIISGPQLKGGLQHTDEELRVDLCQFSLEELTRIWNALSKPYRLSVCYEVRIIMIDSAVEQPVQRVLERENRYSKYNGR